MQRIDKWLWYSRALKTRSLAAAAVSEGRVRVNGVRIDAPAKAVKPGDVVTIGLPARTLVWKVIAGGERRGPASEAQRLYDDLSPPDQGAGDRSPRAGRPEKRERRAIDRLLGRS